MIYIVAFIAGMLWAPVGAILVTKKVKRVDVADINLVTAVKHFGLSSFWILATATPPALMTYAYGAASNVAFSNLHFLSLAAAVALPFLALGELRRRKAGDNG